MDKPYRNSLIFIISNAKPVTKIVILIFVCVFALLMIIPTIIAGLAFVIIVSPFKIKQWNDKVNKL